MLKTLCLSLAAFLGCLLFTSAPDCLAKDEPKDAKAEKDQFILYRIAGRSWLLRRTPKPGQEGGDDQITYHRFEVKNSYADRADIVQQSLDASRKGGEGSEISIKIEFKEDGPVFKDPIGFKKGKTEKLKTDAGTFDCTVFVALGKQDGDCYIWRSNDFPGLVVKQDDRFGTRELTEFDWCDGDPGYKADTKKKKKPAPKELDDKRLFKSKGASWVHRTDTKRGERGTLSIDVVQTLVKKVTDSECELEISKLSQLLEKMKGEEPELRVIKFDDTFAANLEPKERARQDRTEKRITKVGLFECTVYTFKDDEGREGQAWYATEWPGLLLKREVKGENYSSVTELIKFEE